MPYSGYEVNRRVAEPWAAAIGRVLLNFGALELLSYAWIEQLSSRDLLLKTLKKPFSARCKLAVELVELADAERDVKTSASRAWSKAAALAKFRNWLAHNPLALERAGRQPGAPVKSIGIINFARMSGGKPTLMPRTTLRHIGALNREILDLVKELDELMKRLASRAGGTR